MSESAESWIVELRARLAEPPPRRYATGGNGSGAKAPPPRRAAALLPLWVDAGELWTLITERAQRLAGHQSPPAFPGALAEQGEKPWLAALRGGESEAGLDPRAAVDLGRLDEATTPAGVVIVPCVAAYPRAVVEKRAAPAAETAVEAVVPLPLSALARPQLIERRPVEVDGRGSEITVLHLGRRRVWGVTAELALNLLARLGMAPAAE